MNKIVVIGHVDAGKSTLVGQLLVKLKAVESHVIEQIKSKAIREKKESQIFSRMTDIFEEEMEKGKTHEFNEVEFSHLGVNYILIDTPGHQSYVRSMIGGISRDVKNAILVVSMKENEFQASFVDGMLKEHLTLAKAIGIENLIIVANKMDLIEWDKDFATKQLLLVKSFLIKELKWDLTKLKICPIDAYSGRGVNDLDGCVNWLKTTLIDAIVKLPLHCDTSLKDKITTNKLKIKCSILRLGEKEIISKMFLCVLHYDGKETDATICDIIKKPFIKEGCNATIIFDLPEKICIASNAKIIIRKNDMTLGFGEIELISK